MVEIYTRDNVRDHTHIGIPITTSTDGEILAYTIVNVIHQFNLVSKLVGITSDGKTNLATGYDILESSFDNMGLFELKNPMFVIECLSHILSNSCKAVVMDAESDDVRVYTEVTRRNMQRCITCKKITKGGR